MIGRRWMVGVVVVCLSIVAGVAVVLAQSPASGQAPKVGENGPYAPPVCVPGVPFADITCTTGFDPWIEQFGLDGITAGCGGGNYCPGTPVTRDQMAVFIEKSMRGTANWPPHTVLVFHHPAAEASSDVNSGAELLAMVAAIPTIGSEAPSATNPWLVRLGPGIFDLGSGSLTLPAYTALEGAGGDITVITAAGYAATTHGTLIMGDHGRLSRLTVNNSGGNNDEIAVYLPSLATNVALEHVTVTATNPSNAVGVAYGLYAAANTSFSLVDCELTVHGASVNYGIKAYSSTDELRLDRVRVDVYGTNASGSSFGFYSDGARPVISNSRLQVSDGAVQSGIRVLNGSGTFDLRNSEVYTNVLGTAVVVSSTNATLQGDLLYSPYDAIATSGTQSADISNCNITGTTNWLDNASGFTVTVGASKLTGKTTGAGTTHCFGNYTGSAFLASTCP